MKRKIFGIVVLVLLVTSIGCLVGFNWQGLTAVFGGSQIYTREQMEENYQKGYADANTNENLLLEQNAYYKVLVEDCENSILNYQQQISSLTNSNKIYNEQIDVLEKQRDSLQADVERLESIKAEDAQTKQSLSNQIASLNTVILNLNTQISEMSLLTQTYTSQINALTNRVNELQASVNYYESYIATLENGEQAVATYEVDGTVWKIEIVNKGTELTLTNPVSTENKIFNGWTVNGSNVGNSYVLNTNTKFVADITHKFVVKFIVDDQTHNSQSVVENTTAVMPETPSKAGYEFLGWSTNGVDVIENIDTVAVIENITYVAVFTKLHTVKFIIDDQVVATQTIKNGNYATDVEVETEGMFNGWKVNDVVVELSTYQVFTDTVFVADITPADWLPMAWNGLESFDGNNVWTDGVNYYYSSGASQYVLDVTTHTWSPKTWNGLESFDGNNVWTDGISYYCSNLDFSSFKYLQYVLNVSTHTWSLMTWNITGFEGRNIWTDGVNYYYSSGASQYVLDVTTHTWLKMTWKGFTKIYGDRVWTDGVNCYYSNNSEQYVLDVTTHTWSNMTWKGFAKIYGFYVWTDGVNYYYSYSSDQYVLDVTTHTWLPKTWNGLEVFGASRLWSDGVNLYYSSTSKQYVFARQSVAAKSNSTNTASVYTLDTPVLASREDELMVA